MGADDLLDKFRGLLDDAESVEPQETVFRERYQVIRHIGSGGMGAVFLVRDSVLGREAAMKVCYGEQMEPRLAEQILVEARLAARLEHPNILPIYDMGVDRQKRYFFVMRYVEGESLAGALARGPLPLDRSLEIFLAVCEAIRHAHAQGVLHRDIKPGNVLLSTTGHVFVIDWGISKLVSSAAAGPVDIDRLQTLSSGLVGTPVYLPPEILTNERAVVDARADVYALGILLYNLLGGAKPFEAQSRETLAEAKSGLRLNPVDAPARLLAIVRKAIAPRPLDRYGSVDELMADVRRRNWLARHPAATAAGLTILLAAALFPVIRHLTRDARARNVVVSTLPPGAHIAIRRDQRVVREGASPLEVPDLEFGSYAIEVRSPGHRTHHGNLYVAAGKGPMRLTLVLEPEPGSLAVLPVDPDVIANIDGEGEFPGRTRPIELLPGSYRVTLTRPGTLERRTRTVTIASARTTGIVHDLSETRLWTAGAEAIRGGRLCASPAFVDRDIVIPYLPPSPDDKAVRFAVLDSRTGVRRDELTATVPETVFHLFRGGSSLYAWGRSGFHVLGGPLYKTDSYRDAFPRGSTAIVVETEGLTIVDAGTGAARRAATWDRAFFVRPLLVDGGRRLVVFTQTLERVLRAAAYDAANPGAELWSRVWKGVLNTNIVGADLDRDGIDDFIFSLVVGDEEQLVAVRGSDRDRLWVRPVPRVGRTLLHVRTPSEDAVFSASGHVVHKFEARSGREMWRREFRMDPGKRASFFPAPLDADGDGITDLALGDPDEGVLRIFSGGDGGVLLRRAARLEMGLYSGDFDGNGRDDLLLCGPRELEAFAPAGTEVTVLEPQVPDESTSVSGNPVAGGEAIARGGHLLMRLRLSDGEVLQEVELSPGRRSLEFQPSFVLEGGSIARPRRDISVSFPLPAGMGRMEWDDVDGDGFAELLVHSRTAARMLSGCDGRTLWEVAGLTDVEIRPAYQRDFDGDGVRDLAFESAGLVVHSGRTGAPVKFEIPKEMQGFLWQGRRLVWWSRTQLFREGASYALEKSARLRAIADLTGDGTEELVAEGEVLRILDGERPDRLLWSAPGRGLEVVGSRVIIEDESRLSSYDFSGNRLWRVEAGPRWRTHWAAEPRTGRIGVIRPGGFLVLDPDGAQVQSGGLRGDLEWITWDPQGTHLYVGSGRTVFRIACSGRTRSYGAFWEGQSAPDRRNSWVRE